MAVRYTLTTMYLLWGHCVGGYFVSPFIVRVCDDDNCTRYSKVALVYQYDFAHLARRCDSAGYFTVGLKYDTFGLPGNPSNIR